MKYFAEAKPRFAKVHSKREKNAHIKKCRPSKTKYIFGNINYVFFILFINVLLFILWYINLFL